MIAILNSLQSHEAEGHTSLTTVELASEILGVATMPILGNPRRREWEVTRRRSIRLNSFWRTLKLLESRGLVVGETRIGIHPRKWRYVRE